MTTHGTYHPGGPVPPPDACTARLTDCPCGPDTEYFDPETGETYPSGPLVMHHSLDGRERHEATT